MQQRRGLRAPRPLNLGNLGDAGPTGFFMTSGTQMCRMCRTNEVNSFYGELYNSHENNSGMDLVRTYHMPMDFDECCMSHDNLYLFFAGYDAPPSVSRLSLHDGSVLASDE